MCGLTCAVQRIFDPRIFDPSYICYSYIFNSTTAIYISAYFEDYADDNYKIELCEIVFDFQLYSVMLGSVSRRILENCSLRELRCLIKPIGYCYLSLSFIKQGAKVSTEAGITEYFDKIKIFIENEYHISEYSIAYIMSNYNPTLGSMIMKYCINNINYDQSDLDFEASRIRNTYRSWSASCVYVKIMLDMGIPVEYIAWDRLDSRSIKLFARYKKQIERAYNENKFSSRQLQYFEINFIILDIFKQGYMILYYHTEIALSMIAVDKWYTLCKHGGVSYEMVICRLENGWIAAIDDIWKNYDEFERIRDFSRIINTVVKNNTTFILEPLLEEIKNNFYQCNIGEINAWNKYLNIENRSFKSLEAAIDKDKYISEEKYIAWIDLQARIYKLDSKRMNHGYPKPIEI